MAPVEANARLSAAEAARVLGVTKGTALRLANADRLDAVMVDGEYRIDPASVTAYAQLRAARAARPAAEPLPMRHGRLRAAPLLTLVAASGGDAAVGVSPKSSTAKALARARRDGWLTERAADELAVRLLGITPWEVWPEYA